MPPNSEQAVKTTFNSRSTGSSNSELSNEHANYRYDSQKGLSDLSSIFRNDPAAQKLIANLKSNPEISSSDLSVIAGTLVSLVKNDSCDKLKLSLGSEEKRMALAKGILKNLNNRTDQDLSVTCAPTSLQIGLTKSNPVGYVKWMTEVVQTGSGSIAADTHRYELPSGINIRLNMSSYQDPRTLAERLGQSLLNNTHGNYNAADDKTHMGGVSYGGMYSDQIVEMYNGTKSKTDPDRYVLIHNQMNGYKENIAAALEASTKQGKFIPNMVSLHGLGTGEHQNHAVTVLGISGDKVFFQNPWGPNYVVSPGTVKDLEHRGNGIYSISKEEFFKRMNFAVVASQNGNKWGTEGQGEGFRWEALVEGGNTPPTVFQIDQLIDSENQSDSKVSQKDKSGLKNPDSRYTRIEATAVINSSVAIDADGLRKRTFNNAIEETGNKTSQSSNELLKKIWGTTNKPPVNPG